MPVRAVLYVGVRKVQPLNVHTCVVAMEHIIVHFTYMCTYKASKIYMFGILLFCFSCVFREVVRLVILF